MSTLIDTAPADDDANNITMLSHMKLMITNLPHFYTLAHYGDVAGDDDVYTHF